MTAAAKSTVMLLALVGLSACVHVDPNADLSRAQVLIDRATGFDGEIDLEGFEPATLQELDHLLADGLSLAETLRLGLTNNPTLQAEFLSIGVARSDWVQSGLWSNPSLDLLVAFPAVGDSSQVEAALTHNILDIWRIPVRKRIARQRLDETVYRIARIAGEQVALLKKAYFEVLATGQLLDQVKQNHALLQRAHRAISTREDLGAAAALDVNLARNHLLRAELEVRTALFALDTARRRLARLLSLPLSLNDFTLSEKLEDSIPTDLFSMESLVAVALESRPDLKARAIAVDAAAEILTRERGKRIDEASAGIHMERTETGYEIESLAGPGLTLTLPIFDQNQAQIARAHYVYLQQLRLHQDLEIRIGHDIALAVDRVNNAIDELQFYREQLLPQAQLRFEFAKSSFSEGQTDILILLKAQQRLLETQRDHVATQLRAVASLTRLEETVGVPLDRESR